MNPLDDHKLLLWAMRAGLTRDEVRQAVRRGLDAGRIPRQSADETQAGRQDRLQTVRDYLQDQYLAGYSDYLENIRGMNAQRAQVARESGIPFQREEPMAPWQWRQLPAHIRGRWLTSLHKDLAARDDFNRLAMGPEWVKRQGSSHLFGIEAITKSSFLGIEGDQTLTTWDAGKVMKRIQLLGAHEQVGLTDVPTRRGYIKPGPASVGPDEFSQLRSAFILGGEPGPSGQGYIDPSVGNVTSRRVMDVYAKPGETLTGLPERGTQWLPGQEVRLANELTGFTDRNWGYEVMDYAPITRQVMQGGEMVEQSGYRFVLGREADLSTARVRAKAYGTKLELVRGDLSGITDPMTGKSLGVQFAGAMSAIFRAVTPSWAPGPWPPWSDSPSGTSEPSPGHLTAGQVGDIQAVIAAHVPDPLYFEADRERQAREDRLAGDRAAWLASQLAGKTPAEVRQIVEGRVQSATTVAEMRQVLLDLLPVIAAGLTVVAHRTVELE
jgi:hypothetical protein